MLCYLEAEEPDSGLRPFLGLHLLFAADDVAGIDTAANLIYSDRKAADAAFVSITLLHTFLRTLLRYFLLCHGLLLSR
jgi:hypothetical protein